MDRRLGELIRNGDPIAFERLLAAQWPLLVHYIDGFVGNLDDAKDIAQEAFVRLWEERRRVRPEGPVRAYLYRIGRNLAINECRRRELHRALAAREAAEWPGPPTPVGLVEAAERRAAVREAIAELPPRRREAFVLAHIHDLRHREVAEIMGISPQTVANQISAALTDLRAALGPLIESEQDDQRTQVQWPG